MNWWVFIGWVELSWTWLWLFWHRMLNLFNPVCVRDCVCAREWNYYENNSIQFNWSEITIKGYKHVKRSEYCVAHNCFTIDALSVSLSRCAINISWIILRFWGTRHDTFERHCHIHRWCIIILHALHLYMAKCLLCSREILPPKSLHLNKPILLCGILTHMLKFAAS